MFPQHEPGTVLVKGRELRMLNYAGQWLTPGVMIAMPEPDESWTVLREGWDDAVLCVHRWYAPRVEAPESVPVNHVCLLPAGHDDRHKCSCGAEGFF